MGQCITVYSDSRKSGSIKIIRILYDRDHVGADVFGNGRVQQHVLVIQQLLVCDQVFVQQIVVLGQIAFAVVIVTGVDLNPVHVKLRAAGAKSQLTVSIIHLHGLPPGEGINHFFGPEVTVVVKVIFALLVLLAKIVEVLFYFFIFFLHVFKTFGNDFVLAAQLERVLGWAAVFIPAISFFDDVAQRVISIIVRIKTQIVVLPFGNKPSQTIVSKNNGGGIGAVTKRMVGVHVFDYTALGVKLVILAYVRLADHVAFFFGTGFAPDASDLVFFNENRIEKRLVGKGLAIVVENDLCF